MERQRSHEESLMQSFAREYKEVKREFAAGYIQSFLNDKLLGIEEDTGKFREGLTPFKEVEHLRLCAEVNPSVYSIKDRALQDVDYEELKDCAEFYRDEWDVKRKELKDPDDEDRDEVKNYRLWEYAYDVATEVADIEQQKPKVMNAAENILRRGKTNAEEEVKKIEQKAQARFAGEFVKSVSKKVKQHSVKLSFVEKAAFIASEFDLFQNAEIVALTNRDDPALDKYINLAKRTSLDTVVEALNEVIVNYNNVYEKSGSIEDKKQLQDAIKVQQLFIFASNLSKQSNYGL